MQSAIQTLILSLTYPHRASYYHDWRDAFVESPEYECEEYNILRGPSSQLATSLREADLVIALHSCSADTLQYLKPLVPLLGAPDRPKLVSFVGNEYNFPYVSMVDRLQLFGEARCDLIATQFPLEAGEYLYQGTGARVVAMPHALNPRAFPPGGPHPTRPLDIGVKGYRYPPYLGDNDRNQVLGYFAQNADRLQLEVEIGEDRRSSREDWFAVLAILPRHNLDGSRQLVSRARR